MLARRVVLILSVFLPVGLCQEPRFLVEGVDSAFRFSDSELATFPQRTIKVHDNGAVVRFQGVLLADVLGKVRRPAGDEAGPHFLITEGSDGHQAMFSWVELDPLFRRKAVYVVSKRDGKPLSGDGPFELIVPGEKSNARWVRQLRGLRIGPDTHPYNSEQARWIAAHLPELESIKVGMTRAQLLTVFMEEGGLSSRRWHHYVYKKCGFVKVDVEFDPVGDPDAHGESPDDRITKISMPYLQLTIAD
ncbi:MAG TPA: hypothetical protein VKG25_27495 [Bryobacteraceae bacterium]|nr:hypothetical protein [Bryobacteraceae bacterium]